ncbi:MAG: alkaline phosphatase family protein [Micrococcales bacterium]
MPKMLPALPLAFGNLKDVLRSAKNSLQGEKNPLGLPKVKNSLVIMVDGLGWFNLSNNSGHAPFLKAHLHKSSKGYAGFPSTTSASLVSLATGVPPSEHGFLGYRVFDRRTNETVNLLTGLDQHSVNSYLAAKRISAEAAEFVVISKPEYFESGFSFATFAEARFIGAIEIERRFEHALDELNSGNGKIIYLYVPELDQAAHRFGIASSKWREFLELLDSECKRLSNSVLPNRGIILTADHGVIDIDHSNHIYLDECPALDCLIDVGGDPRATFLYFENSELAEASKTNVNEWLAGRAQAYSIQELIDSGLYSSEVQKFSAWLPDLVVLAAPTSVCYHRSFSKQTSLAMIGQHGGISDLEIAIPILRLGAYSSSLLVP